MMKDIEQIVEKTLGCRAEEIKRMENVSNNTVYRFRAASERYIIKFYRSREWPENGKLPFVNRILKQNQIACAELITFNREETAYPNGYLIEREIKGSTADKLNFEEKEETELYRKLAKLVSEIHRIPIKNFGYIGDGEADYDSLLSFFEDEFDSRMAELLEEKIFTEAQMRKMRKKLFDVLDCFKELPSVLCHGDLSKKNVIVQENGEIVLIDWDDAMAYNWMADVARLTFWMKMNYTEMAYVHYRNIFLEQYETAYRKEEFDLFEKAFHMYVALDSLVYFIGIGNKEMERSVKNYLNYLVIRSY